MSKGGSMPGSPNPEGIAHQSPVSWKNRMTEDVHEDEARKAELPDCRLPDGPFWCISSGATSETAASSHGVWYNPMRLDIVPSIPSCCVFLLLAALLQVTVCAADRTLTVDRNDDRGAISPTVPCPPVHNPFRVDRLLGRSDTPGSPRMGPRGQPGATACNPFGIGSAFRERRWINAIIL